MPAITSTGADKSGAQGEPEPRHSAFEEFSRDERRPAVLLLSALVIAAIFFAIGIMVGRWTSDSSSQPGQTAQDIAGTSPALSQRSPTPQPTPAPFAAIQPTPDPAKRFALLIAQYSAPEEAQPMIKRLEQAGYTDIRTSPPSAGDPEPKFSLLVGRFTRDEALAIAARMRETRDARFKSVRVVEDSADQ